LIIELLAGREALSIRFANVNKTAIKEDLRYDDEDRK